MSPHYQGSLITSTLNSNNPFLSKLKTELVRLGKTAGNPDKMDDYVNPWLDADPVLRKLYDRSKRLNDLQRVPRLLETIFDRSIGTNYELALDAKYVGDLEQELQQQMKKIESLHDRWNLFILRRRSEMTLDPSFKPQLPEIIQLSLPDEIVDLIHSYVPIVLKVKLWEHPISSSHEAELKTLRIKWWQKNNHSLCIPRCIDNCVTSRDCICNKWAGIVLTEDGRAAINRNIRRPSSTKFARCSHCDSLYNRVMKGPLDYLPAAWRICKMCKKH